MSAIGPKRRLASAPHTSALEIYFLEGSTASTVDLFVFGGALKGAGTPILCDTASGLDSSWPLAKANPPKRIIPITRK